MKKWMLFLMLSVFVVSLSACNTVKGVGEDIEAGGEALQDAAD